MIIHATSHFQLLPQCNQGPNTPIIPSTTNFQVYRRHYPCSWSLKTNMASSKQELKKPGTGGSLLAPSKFGANFGRSDKKSLFTGLKASKLTSITQSVCSSSASTIPAQPQHNPATQTALEPPASKPFCDPVGPSPLSSSCTPVISKVTLNTSVHSINPEKKQTAEIQKETPNAEQKVSQGDKKESSFLFGQNLADRAANFVETANGEKTSEVDNVDAKAAQASSFIFGQHLAERVSTTDKDPLQKDQVTKEQEESKKPSDAGAEESKSHDDNKQSEDSSTEVKSISSNSKTDDIKVSISPEKNSSNTALLKTHEPVASLSGKTLNENAAEYFESHLAPPKRKFDEVEVITGEENEHNVLHMSAKLYIFDKNKSWLEKGRGELRLNDLSVAAANATSNTVGLTSSQARYSLTLHSFIICCI